MSTAASASGVPTFPQADRHRDRSRPGYPPDLGQLRDAQASGSKAVVQRTPSLSRSLSPTSASWLNQVERWFAEITRKRIRRGTFRSVRDLVQAIQEYIRENNKNPRPFQWVATANTILRKVRKYQWTLETGD